MRGGAGTPCIPRNQSSTADAVGQRSISATKGGFDEYRRDVWHAKSGNRLCKMRRASRARV